MNVKLKPDRKCMDWGERQGAGVEAPATSPRPITPNPEEATVPFAVTKSLLVIPPFSLLAFSPGRWDGPSQSSPFTTRSFLRSALIFSWLSCGLRTCEGVRSRSVSARLSWADPSRLSCVPRIQCRIRCGYSVGYGV